MLEHGLRIDVGQLRVAYYTDDGTFPVADTNATDYAELQRTFSWGGIEIQRAWVDMY